MFEKIYSNRTELMNLIRFKDTYPKYIIKTADTKKEQRQAQQLRYKVFADEIKAITNSKGLLKKREVDSYDEESQHIIVRVKTSPFSLEKIVGVYRIMEYNSSTDLDKSYSASAMGFDISLFKKNIPYHRFLELGRTCILPEYRKSGVLKLLWKGLYKYIVDNDIDILFGCASFWTIDPDDIREQLTYLKKNYLMDNGIMVSPRDDLYTDNGIGLANINYDIPQDMTDMEIFKSLPSLIKAYIKVGSKFGDGAVIDYEFGSIDVFTYVDVNRIDYRVKNYYSK